MASRDFSGITILTDPVWSERASPFRRIGSKRVRKPGVAFEGANWRRCHDPQLVSAAMGQLLTHVAQQNAVPSLLGTLLGFCQRLCNLSRPFDKKPCHRAQRAMLQGHDCNRRWLSWELNRQHFDR